MSPTATIAPATLDAVNLETIETLKRETTPEVVSILLDEFSSGLLARIGQLVTQISDTHEIRAEALVLKSEAATFGGAPLAQSFAAIEQAATAGTGTTLKELIEGARFEAKRYIESLNNSRVLRPAII